MVMEETHIPKVVGSNPGTIYWMDFFTNIFCKNCNDVCLKRLKLNEKEAALAHFLKKVIFVNSGLHLLIISLLCPIS